MELELHVGPLTAFFAPAVRADAFANREPLPEIDEVRARIVEWRDWLGEGLAAAGHVTVAPRWDEDDPSPAERIRVMLDAVRALKLAIAYGSLSKSPSQMPERPDLDPRWNELAAGDFASTPFDQVMVPEFWLPGAFEFTFACPLPDGHEVQAGATGTLCTQLGRVLEEVLEATPLEAALWSNSTPPPTERRLPALARHGAVVMRNAALRAVERRAPLLWTAATPHPDLSSS